MLEQFPGVVVPTLPPKGSFGVEDHFGSSFVNRRRRGLHFWLGHVVGHPLMGNTPEVRVFLGASRDHLKKIRDDPPEPNPILEQQIAMAHQALQPSSSGFAIDPELAVDWVQLYSVNWVQKERMLMRVARAASAVSEQVCRASGFDISFWLSFLSNILSA